MCEGCWLAMQMICPQARSIGAVVGDVKILFILT